jgi:hypothetical protein
MQNFEIVQGFQAFHNLDEDIPDIGFVKHLILFLLLNDLLVEVAIVGELHHDAV